MYPKHITERIVELWALGFTAEETRTALQEQHNKKIGLATIYRHRHSLTAQNLIDELLRHQERSILKADSSNPELAMKYRNELLKILLPQRIEQSITQNVDVNVTTELLKHYELVLREEIPSQTKPIQPDGITEQVHPPQTNRQTSPVPMA